MHPGGSRTRCHERLYRPVIVSPTQCDTREWNVLAKAMAFLCDIFDRWVVAIGRYYVQMFDATLAQYCGVQPGVCSMGETCGDALVVEHNGDVYNCDHFVYPEYLLGNIREESLLDIYNSPQRFRFGLNKRNTLPKECLRCNFYFACRRECPKHRFDKWCRVVRKIRFARSAPLFCALETHMERMRDLLSHKQSPRRLIRWQANEWGLLNNRGNLVGSLADTTRTAKHRTIPNNRREAQT